METETPDDMKIKMNLKCFICKKELYLGEGVVHGIPKPFHFDCFIQKLREITEEFIHGDNPPKFSIDEDNIDEYFEEIDKLAGPALIHTPEAVKVEKPVELELDTPEETFISNKGAPSGTHTPLTNPELDSVSRIDEDAVSEAKCKTAVSSGTHSQSNMAEQGQYKSDAPVSQIEPLKSDKGVSTDSSGTHSQQGINSGIQSLKRNQHAGTQSCVIHKYAKGKNPNSRNGFKKGHNNTNWKGNKVKYNALHQWINRFKPKPEKCERCNKRRPYDLANISGRYERNVNDFEWICRKCHMEKDGRILNLKQYQDE